MIPCSLSISFLHLFIFFLSYLRHLPFLFKFLFYSLGRFLSCFLSSYMLFISTHHHHNHIIVFSLCPLEEKLHTYLTTWLSLCSVTIFYGSLTIFCLPKHHKQSETHKMCNLKINSHQQPTTVDCCSSVKIIVDIHQ